MEREKFGSRIGFILVSAGCAIGIGNVWKFPYMAGQFGGAIFVLFYLLFLVLMGIPVMTMELSVGRASRKSAVLSYKALEKEGFAQSVCRKLKIEAGKPDLEGWKQMVKKAKHPERNVTIGMVGKYVKLHDAYLSVSEALTHAGYHHSSKVRIKWFDAENINQKNVAEKLKDCDGIKLN